MKRDNQGNPRRHYYDRIAGMADTELFKETKDKIWLSADASNNPRSDYHWQVDGCYDEWAKRRKASRYSLAHRHVMRAEGYAV